jgi:acetylornithine deacetylase
MVVSDSVKKKVLTKVDEMSDDITKLLQEMVRIPSVVGDELKAQQHMASVFRNRMGLKTDVFEADMNLLRKHPDYYETTSFLKKGGVDYKDRPNVVATLKGTGGGKSMIYSGHIDVVSPEPINKWKHDPWGGEIVEGKLYGRGSGDMKCGIAAMTMAVRCLQELGIKLKGDVMLETLIEEEDGGVGGAFASVLHGYTADGCINTEPMGPTSVTLGCVGTSYFRVTVPGVTAHAARAHEGVNAIGKALKVYNALVDLNEYRQKTIRNPLFEAALGMAGHATTLNIGSLRCGDWPSTVAGWCTFECRISIPTNETLEHMQKQVQDTVKGVQNLDPFLKDREPIKVEWFGWRARPSVLEAEHPLPQMVKRIAEDITGQQIQMSAATGSCDDRHWRLYGNTPAIMYGPAGVMVHGIDEYCDLKSLPIVTKVLALSLLDWCGYEQ